jgi:hypothetical protein
MGLHEILRNRDAQTDFRTVQDSEFIGYRRDLTQSTVTTLYDNKEKKKKESSLQFSPWLVFYTCKVYETWNSEPIASFRSIKVEWNTAREIY